MLNYRLCVSSSHSYQKQTKNHIPMVTKRKIVIIVNNVGY